MITIYHLNSSRSDRIIWLMEQLGLPYRLEPFRRKPGAFAPDELKHIHSLGRATGAAGWRLHRPSPTSRASSIGCIAPKAA